MKISAFKDDLFGESNIFKCTAIFSFTNEESEMAKAPSFSVGYGRAWGGAGRSRAEWNLRFETGLRKVFNCV